MDAVKVQQEKYQSLLNTFKTIVGAEHLLLDPAMTKRYRSGFFYGFGDALCVVKPGSLVEFYKVVKACVDADVIVINQAANTGVTGGSTPWGNDYDRPIVIINTLRIDGIQLVNVDTDNPQAVCFAGSTLYRLEDKLAEIGREPHSVIGSSCIGASVVGGICNNSGGTLVQRGPAFTELACYCQLHKDGTFEFVNNLGIDLGNGTPEEQLEILEKGLYKKEDVYQPEGKLASSRDYKDVVNQVDEPSPSRFNADPRRLKEASGSAGHLAVFAVRVDTFAKPKRQQMFFIGTNNPQELTDIRRAVLTKFDGLPVLGEYLRRDSFDDALKYAKDTYFVLEKWGTKHLPKMYSLKDFYDRNFGKYSFLPSADTVLQFLGECLPNPLPQSMMDYRDKYEHYLILISAEDLIEPHYEWLTEYFKPENNRQGNFFKCSPEEHKKAMLLRFSVAGSLVRSRHVHRNETEGLIALDVALRRNDDEWHISYPPEVEEALYSTGCCAHFLCHVFHQDYLVKKGYNLDEIKDKILDYLRNRGAEYPAEHNVGHLYEAKPALRDHYKNLDPTNSFNPGVGKQSKAKYWGEPCGCGCDHHHEEAK